MSMNGRLRQVSPRVLHVLTEQPELVSAARDWEASASPPPSAAVGAAEGDASDPLAGLPAHIRCMFENLPEEAQRAAAAEFTARLETMKKSSPYAGIFAAMEEEDDEERERLRAAGVGDEDLPEALEIDKSWHGLHFLLTGKAWETEAGAGEAVLGGVEVGEDDSGYGPARVMTPDEVAAVAEALGALDEGELRARYRADAFIAAEIYPRGWEDSDEFADWMVDTFREVRDYYADARRRGYGMLLAIT